MEEEWGPEIVHDGNSVPVPVGTIVKIVRRNGVVHVVKVGAQAVNRESGELIPLNREFSHKTNLWVWGSTGMPPHEVLSYQVKKPKGLQILEQIVLSTNIPVAGPKKLVEALYPYCRASAPRNVNGPVRPL